LPKRNTQLNWVKQLTDSNKALQPKSKSDISLIKRERPVTPSSDKFSKQGRISSTISLPKKLSIPFVEKKTGKSAIVLSKKKLHSVGNNKKTTRSQEAVDSKEINTKNLSKKRSTFCKQEGMVKRFSDFHLLQIGDMVAMKTSENLVIPGQPCVGKILSLPNQNDQLVIHLFTGSFNGRWWPMSCRQSPYIRDVSKEDIIHQFALTDKDTMCERDVNILKTFCIDKDQMKCVL